MQEMIERYPGNHQTLVPAVLLCLAIGCTSQAPAAESGMTEDETGTDDEVGDEADTETDTDGETGPGPDPDMMQSDPECTEFSELEVAWNIDSSVPRVVRGEDLRLTAEDCEDAEFEDPASLEDAALAVAEALRPLYGLGVEHTFEVAFVGSDALGFTHVRLTHRYAGVVVSGSQLIVHFDGSDRAYELNGHLFPVSGVDVTPTSSSDNAEAAAQVDFDQAHPGLVGAASSLELVVHVTEGGPRLAYAFDMSAGDLLWRRYVVDAHDDSLLVAVSGAREGLEPEPGEPATITGQRLAGEGGGTVERTGWRGDMTSIHHLFNEDSGLSVHDAMDCGSFQPACISEPTSMWGASDPFGLSGFANLLDTVDYFQTTHGWAPAKAPRMVVRFPNDCFGPPNTNAFFLPGYAPAYLILVTVPAPGDSPLGTTDIVGHEYTHAVVNSTAGLIYQGESGALDESYADIFGALVEFAAQPDNAASYPASSPGAADWLLGEDAGSPFRDMRDPAAFNDPTRYAGNNWADTSEGAFDFGGVHTNSGVQNQFFYFLSEGGAGNNDGIPYDLTGIGRAAAAQIGYRAMTLYTAPSSDYADSRQAWRSAAIDLGGEHLAAVEAAWEAVGVGACPTWFPDSDMDGFGDTQAGMEACEQPPGHIDVGGDCDDTNAARYPGAAEVCGDGVINDCAIVFCEDDPDAPDCVDVEAFCGNPQIAVVMSQIQVSWSTDCLLQTSPDLVNWTDYRGELDVQGCDQAAQFPPGEQLFFRLRTH